MRPPTLQVGLQHSDRGLVEELEIYNPEPYTL